MVGAVPTAVLDRGAGRIVGLSGKSELHDLLEGDLLLRPLVPFRIDDGRNICSTEITPVRCRFVRTFAHVSDTGTNRPVPNVRPELSSTAVGAWP